MIVHYQYKLYRNVVWNGFVVIERKYSICYSDEDGRDNDDNMRSDIFAASFLGHNFINDGLSKWTTTKY